MPSVAGTSGLRHSFGSSVALDGVDLALPAGSIIGLVGRNGSGKTTLLRVLAGLLVPTAGTCRVLGVPSDGLQDEQLRQLGYVSQEGRLLAWMTVRQHLDYVAAFHPAWDEARERRLVDALELDARARVGALSPGNAQKLAIVLAVCHHPALLLLDEPVSALDPLARETLLAELLALLNEDGLTIVISSHVLRDVERVVDRIVCLERGRVVQDAPLDDLKERYAEWRVVSRDGRLPARFAEPFVLAQSGNSHLAQLAVLDAGDSLAAFEARHEARVEAAPLNLERMFPLWVGRAVRR